MRRKRRKDNKKDGLVTRREMLRRLGNYSAIAAAVLAAPSALLLKGCGGGGGGGGVGPTGDTADTAIPIGLGGSVSDISLDADSNGVIYYKFDTQDGPVEGTIDVTSVTADYSDAVVCTILDSDLEVVETPISFDAAVSILLDLEPGIYYIVFECANGTATFSFELLDTSQPYSDWSDTYSDWTDAWSDTYSDWTDTYSDWSDTYSDWSNVWTNYSDYWSNYWGNWMQSW